MTRNPFAFGAFKPLKVQFSGPGKISAKDLEIYYNCTFEIKDFSVELNDYIATHGDLVTDNGTIIIPFNITVPASTKGRIKVSDLRLIFNHKPSLKLKDLPAGGTTVSEPVVRLKWTDFDEDDNAGISLYFDPDNSGYDGELIIANLSEDDEDDYFDWPWWNWEVLRSGGAYYIYANITDGINYDRHYSAGPVNLQIINIKDFLNITIHEPDGVDDEIWECLNITWTSYSYYSNDGAKIFLYYDDDSVGYNGTGIDISGDGQVDDQDFIAVNSSGGLGAFSFNISTLPPGVEYYIYAKITNDRNLSYYNYSSGKFTRVHMPAPRNFTLLDDYDASDGYLSTHNANPRFNWLSLDHGSPGELEYVFRLWSGADNLGEKVYEDTTTDTNITVAKLLTYHQTYYAELFARLADGNVSMKTGLVFELVNSGPSAPIIVITPAAPTTISNLTCTIINHSQDPEEDALTYSYSWVKNGDVQHDYNNNTTVRAKDTEKGDHWGCTVTAYDGIDLGSSAFVEVIIVNSPPQIRLESPVQTKEYVDNKIIPVKFVVTDPDPGDNEQIQYIVYANEKENKLKTGYADPNTGVVEFPITLKEGEHNITITVSDGSASSDVTLTVVVKGYESTSITDVLLPIIAGIILIIIILLIIFLALLSRIQHMKKVVIDKDRDRDSELEE